MCSADRAALSPLLKTPGAKRLAFSPNGTCPLTTRLSLFDHSSALAVTAYRRVRNELIAHRVTHLMFHRAPVRAELK